MKGWKVSGKGWRQNYKGDEIKMNIKVNKLPEGWCVDCKGTGFKASDDIEKMYEPCDCCTEK